MEKSNVRQAFNSAASAQSKQKQDFIQQKAQGNSSPALVLKPPTTQKAMQAQMAMDKVAAHRNQDKKSPEKSPVKPSSKEQFAKNAAKQNTKTKSTEKTQEKTGNLKQAFADSAVKRPTQSFNQSAKQGRSR
ncbi:hypothetical protein [Pseudoalteromonas rubra]|uniref:Uncharacterized protein n=1 Tax=Pseudoalteromonas rubra TaxID=43658 RepID=A0A0U3HN81_9GAMM|nr:hypothetical protein [Pseudoalteromonas rubra]ALU42392.1 hypothetical protein AT705_05170 [Pseudoalteromonas rubra]